MKKLLSILLAMMMLIGLAPLPQNVQAEEAEFQIIVNVPKHNYIPILIDGFEGTIFAFVDRDGAPQFRVYGKLGSQKGFFPVEITNDGEVNITDTKPVKDATNSFGQAKIPKEAESVPEGFQKTARKNIFAMINLFGEKEHVAYASYDGENFGFYPIAKNNQPVPGSLPLDMDAMLEHSKATVGKKYKRPSNLKGEFSRAVVLTTSEGGSLAAMTGYPALDLDSITSGGRATASYTGTGTGTGSGKSSNTYKKYQTVLKNLGFYSGPIDGKIGDGTTNAIKAYQGKNGLSVTGKFDNATVAKLKGTSHINAAGNPVSTAAVDVATDQAAANKGIENWKAVIKKPRSQYSTTENITLSVTLSDTNNTPNVKTILQVIGPHGQVGYQSGVGNISLTLSGLAEGNYTVKSFLNAGNGNAGRDLKTFKVVKDLAIDPGELTEEEKKSDILLKASISASASAVKINDQITVTFQLNDTYNGNTYSSVVESSTGARNTSSTAKTILTFNAPGTTGEVTVTGTVTSSSGKVLTRTVKISVTTDGSSGSGMGNQSPDTQIAQLKSEIAALEAENSELNAKVTAHTINLASVTDPAIRAQMEAEISAWNSKIAANNVKIAEKRNQIIALGGTP